MATSKYTINGYGVIDMTHVASRKTGQIEAQLPLNSTDFLTVPAENGMLLKVNRADGSVDLPGLSDGGLYLHASEEKNYTVDALGLSNFSMLYQAKLYPRMYLLQPGDTFITNCVAYNTTSYADADAVDTAVALYATTDVLGIPSITGQIALAKVADIGTPKCLLRVIDVTTLPNGLWALEFEVQKNNVV